MGSFDYGPAYGRGNLLEHHALESVYPPSELVQHTNVKDSMTLLNTDRGAFDQRTKTLTVFAPASVEQGKSTTLHELQHAIQQREGMARGGSPEAISREGGEARYIADEISHKLERLENQAGAEADLWLEKYPERVKEAIEYMKVQDLFERNRDGDGFTNRRSSENRLHGA